MKTTGQGEVWLTIISSAPNEQGYVTPGQADELTANRKAVRAKVDAALSAGTYAEGESLIPEAVDDPKGQLSEELVFWRRLATDMKPGSLGTIARTIGLSELPNAFSALLAGAGKGRTVVSIG